MLCVQTGTTLLGKVEQVLGVLPVTLAYALVIASQNCMQDRKNELHLQSTCYLNLLSKLSIIFKEWRIIVLFVL